MSVFDILSFFLFMSTVAVIINRKFFKLPETIGILIFSLLTSLFLYGISFITGNTMVVNISKKMVTSTDMPYLFLNCALPLLLFAGAMQLNLKRLMERVISIISLAIPGALITIFTFATGLWYILPFFGLKLSFLWCVVAGAILAPTDPVSVVALIKRLGLPAPVQAVVAGESLFNDGVGVVIFTTASALALSSSHVINVHDQLNNGFNLLLREAVGGILVGFITGYIAASVLKKIADVHIGLLITITLTLCTFSLATALETSGAIAVVVSGLWMGADYTISDIPDKVKIAIRDFWELIEGIINSLLFLTMGAEVLLMLPSRQVLPVIGVAIILSLVSRLVGVVLATLPLPVKYDSKNRLWSLLTWGGLRGGVSIALALGLPDGPVRNILAPICYSIVLFSIIVQGLTMEKVTKMLYPSEEGMEKLKNMVTTSKDQKALNAKVDAESVDNLVPKEV